MADRGRPSKLTPEIQNTIVQAILVGNYADTAAVYAGVSRETFYAWMKRAGLEMQHQAQGFSPRESESIFVNFSDAVRKAEAEADVRDVTQMAAHGLKRWEATAWRLERRNPKKWGMRIKLHVEEELENVLNKLEKKLSPDEYEKVLEIIASDESEQSTGDDSEQANKEGASPQVNDGESIDAVDSGDES